MSPYALQPWSLPTIRSLDPVRARLDGFSAYPTTRLPSPFSLPEVDPDPDTTCRFTLENSTVGWPPTPEETYVGARTAVVPAPHEGPNPVPPERTAWPALVGTHSSPG